jgi:DNA-binding NtrC family response regulator
MVMPGGIMGGELAERLLSQCPGLKVIYTSGYSPGMAGRDASLLEGRNFLPKPYSIGKLAQFVRECLDTPAKQNGILPGVESCQCRSPGTEACAAS